MLIISMVYSIATLSKGLIRDDLLTRLLQPNRSQRLYRTGILDRFPTTHLSVCTISVACASLEVVARSLTTMAEILGAPMSICLVGKVHTEIPYNQLHSHNLQDPTPPHQAMLMVVLLDPALLRHRILVLDKLSHPISIHPLLCP